MSKKFSDLATATLTGADLVAVSSGGVSKKTTAQDIADLAAGANAWTTALDLDFSAEANQSLSTDGTFTIAGKTWTKANSAHDGTAMAIVNGSGLVIVPDSSSNRNSTTDTAPQLHVPLASLSASIALGSQVRIEAYFSAANHTANYDYLCVGVYAPGIDACYEALRGYNGSGNMLSQILGAGTSYSSTRSATLDSTNDCLTLDIEYLGRPTQTVLSGPHQAGADPFPTDAQKVVVRSSINAAAVLDALTVANASVFVAAWRGGSGTSFSVTLERLRVLYR